MKKQTINRYIRWALVFTGIVLIAVNYLPIWSIELSAPQYPEGLALQIYAGRLGGNIDVINGLNHYIGMKTLHANDFAEFTVLPWIVIFFSLAFIICGILNRKRFLYVLFSLFVVFGIVAMVDFWRWEYNYGHDLNPDAAIKVPGMAYQPPLIGYKQLLNFGAYAMPGAGGWIFITAEVILAAAVIVEIREGRKIKTSSVNLTQAAMLLSVCLILTSCRQEPQPIIPGKDNCSFCKMTVTDIRFGGEIITDKGKMYKFDDMHCLLAFLQMQPSSENEKNEVYVVNFTGTHQLIKASSALLLSSEALRSPMNGNIAAFDDTESFNSHLKLFSGRQVLWNNISVK